MKKVAIIITGLLLIPGMLVSMAGAQQERGSIRGAVYHDVNGDGVCVGTGVAGEDPVPGIDIEFVSSDEATVITLYTGDDGTYGLVAAGQSIWRVSAKPDPTKWFVTSENPLYVPVLPEDGLVQTGVNFCISQGAFIGGPGNAVIILPESGAAATGAPGWLAAAGLTGLALVFAGALLEGRRRLQR